jgi:hypothetical protein
MIIPYFLTSIPKIQTIERIALWLFEKHNKFENVIAILNQPIKKTQPKGESKWNRISLIKCHVA